MAAANSGSVGRGKDTTKRMSFLESEMLRALAKQARNATIHGNFKQIQGSIAALVNWDRSITDDHNGELSEEEMVNNEKRAVDALREALEV